jgi:hypothetical protein
MYGSDFSITSSPLTSSAPYNQKRPVKILACIMRFLLQIWKQQEDSAMLLASNKQHKEITKNRKTRQDRHTEKDSREEQTPKKERARERICCSSDT